MNTKLILAATATLLLSTTAATVSIAQQNETEKGSRGMTIERALDVTERMFNHLDTDNDGVLSMDEINAGPDRSKMAEAMDGERPGKGKGKGKGKKGRPVVKLLLGENGFTAGMDWDAVEAQVAANFNELDVDNNDRLTRDEIKPVMDAMKAARKAS